MKRKRNLKIVSDARPNSDGHWVPRKVRPGAKIWKLHVKAGYHVVAARR